MALLNQVFSVDTLPEAQDFSPIPAGEYSAAITSAEVCTTKAGTGQYIKLRFDVTDPTHAGRVVFTNLNIKNPNPKAEEIGHQQLGSLLRAIGLSRVEDTDQLIGGQCLIKVTVRKDETYGDSNEVKGYKAINGSAPPMPQAQQQVPQAAAQTGQRPPLEQRVTTRSRNAPIN